MPLCPQVTNTPITVVQNSDFSVTAIIPAIADTTDGFVSSFDKKIETFYQPTAPTNASRGDIWFDTDDGNKQYWFDGTNWVVVQDAAIAAATAAANAAIADANAALAEAADAYALASTSIQTSANTIVNASNQLTAINGNGITVYAGASASTGARVLLNSTGIVGYNASNSPTFTLNASNGNVSITGASFTSGTISGGSLNINGNCIINTSGFLTATGATITGAITATSGSFTGTVTSSAGSIGGWAITATALTRTVGNKTMTLDSSSATINILDTSGGTLTSGGMSITSSGQNLTIGATGLFFSNGTGAVVDYTSSGALRLQTPSARYIRLVPNAGSYSTTYPVAVEGSLDVYSQLSVSSRVFMPGISSTANAANVRWGTAGGGEIFYSTASSQRFKENIVDLANVAELDPKKLLDLPVRAFTYKEDYLKEPDDRAGVLVPGFIAEEVDQVYPIAADYEEDGPNNWNEKFMIPAMLSLIQDLYKEIKILKGE